MLLTFLKSDELKKLHDESERFLADGMQVILQIQLSDNKPSYELKLD